MKAIAGNGLPPWLMIGSSQVGKASGFEPDYAVVRFHPSKPIKIMKTLIICLLLVALAGCTSRAILPNAEVHTQNFGQVQPRVVATPAIH